MIELLAAVLLALGSVLVLRTLYVLDVTFDRPRPRRAPRVVRARSAPLSRAA